MTPGNAESKADPLYWVFRPADWLLDSSPLPFYLLVMPVAAVQVLWWLALALPVVAALCAPWVGLGYLIWRLTHV